MKKHLSTILLVGVFLLGLGILLYPSVSDYWNSMHQTRAISAYEDTLSGMTQKDYSEYFAQADAYNAALASLPTPLTGYEVLDTLEEVPKYRDVLDVNGMGIMGYIDIDEIGVELPIYHGTDPSVLNVAVGHLEGTSLPVGGVGTHCVLSAHRGLPSARLFTDLDRLKVGDTFTLTVLNRLLTYQVDQVLIVEPEQVEALAIDPNEDYCTLVTCTPYGINSHRLLVRGHRVENREDARVVRVTADAMQIAPVIVAPLLAIPLLLILLIVQLLPRRKR